MPSRAIVSSACAEFFRAKPSDNEPVGVFIGGTSGIGRAMVLAFHRYTGGKCHIVIMARNKAAAEEVFAGFEEAAPAEGELNPVKWRREFRYCDVSLMKEVREASEKLCAELPKINYLVLSCGMFSLWGPRDTTQEGLAYQLALRYYSRWKFIHDLLPLLRASVTLGEDARVLDINATGFAWPVPEEDLGLKDNYTGWRAVILSMVYNDYMVEEFALREPDIAFTHIHPGSVRTPHLEFKHWLLTSPIIDTLVRGFMWLITMSAEASAEYMWYAVVAGEKGFFRRTWRGDSIGRTRYNGSPNERQRVWDHSVEETNH